MTGLPKELPVCKNTSFSSNKEHKCLHFIWQSIFFEDSEELKYASRTIVCVNELNTRVFNSLLKNVKNA